MRHERGRRSAGFSLVEVVVAIAILGTAVIPVSGGLVLSHRLNARSEQILQARLAVSGAVETLMARGIEVNEDEEPVVPDIDGVEINVDPPGEEDKYGAFPVMVTSTAEESVSVTTYIRLAPTPEETTEEGGGGG